MLHRKLHGVACPNSDSFSAAGTEHKANDARIGELVAPSPAAILTQNLASVRSLPRWFCWPGLSVHTMVCFGAPESG